MRKSYNHVHLTDASLVSELDWWIRLPSGATTATDSVTGGNISVASAIADNGDGTFSIDTGGAAVDAGFVGPDVSSADFMFFGVVQATTGNISYIELRDSTASNYTGISISSTSSKVQQDGGTNISLDVLTQRAAGTLSKFAVICDADGDAYLWQAAVGGTMANTLNPAMTGLGGTIDFGLNGSTNITMSDDLLGSGVMDAAGLGFAHFTSGTYTATQMLNMCDWMCERWAAEYKELYPGLRWG